MPLSHNKHAPPLPADTHTTPLHTHTQKKIVSKSKQTHQVPEVAIQKNTRRKTKRSYRRTVIVQKLLVEKCHVQCRAKQNTKGQSKDMCTPGHTKKKSSTLRFQQTKVCRAYGHPCICDDSLGQGEIHDQINRIHLLNLQITFNEMSNVWF